MRILSLLAVFLPLPAVGQQSIPDYRPVGEWMTLPPEITLGPVSAVAVDSSDRLYIHHRGKRPIVVLDSEGKYLRSWGDELAKTPHGLKIDPAGNVWTTDMANHLVLKYDPEGKLLLKLGKKDEPGDGPDRFNKPTDVAFAANGDFYVTDGYGNARVLKFDKDSKLLKQWGTKGSGDGEFNLPHSVVVDAKGRVIVGDRENHRIQVFDPDGKLLTVWKESGYPYGLALHGERLFVADAREHWIKVLDLDGKPLGRFGRKGTGSGEFQSPHMLCVDSKGVLYVAEVGNKRVQKFVAKSPNP